MAAWSFTHGDTLSEAADADADGAAPALIGRDGNRCADAGRDPRASERGDRRHASSTKAVRVSGCRATFLYWTKTREPSTHKWQRSSLEMRSRWEIFRFLTPRVSMTVRAVERAR